MEAYSLQPKTRYTLHMIFKVHRRWGVVQRVTSSFLQALLFGFFGLGFALHNLTQSHEQPTRLT